MSKISKLFEAYGDFPIEKSLNPQIEKLINKFAKDHPELRHITGNTNLCEIMSKEFVKLAKDNKYTTLNPQKVSVFRLTNKEFEVISMGNHTVVNDSKENLLYDFTASQYQSGNFKRYKIGFPLILRPITEIEMEGILEKMTNLDDTIKLQLRNSIPSIYIPINTEIKTRTFEIYTLVKS